MGFDKLLTISNARSFPDKTQKIHTESKCRYVMYPKSNSFQVSGVRGHFMFCLYDFLYNMTEYDE